MGASHKKLFSYTLPSGRVTRGDDYYRRRLAPTVICRSPFNMSKFQTNSDMKKTDLKKLKAFSLPEMLVVLVIIGILVLIALPNLMPLISKAKSTEAQQQLNFLHTLQKSHFYTYSRYSELLEELGFEQQKLVTDGGNANYIIEITEASEKGFKATATAIVDFNNNGTFNVWEINHDKELKETAKD